MQGGAIPMDIHQIKNHQLSFASMDYVSMID